VTAQNAQSRFADRPWWRDAVVYQIYPRSFADSNGDGIGDLPGITSRVEYLQQLGVDAVWLSPFYPSALADGGYDVDDYRAVDPRLGTLEDFDRMRKTLDSAGIRLLIDIVPNHTSNRHAWFREALAAGRDSAARNRYIFRDGLGPGGSQPPSDWDSLFGGPAWTRLPDGQWYLHLFAEEQPDLNWDNREVRDDFLTTIRFWSDRGVDGFRVDVAHALAKDLTEPLAAKHELPSEALPDGTHPLWDRDEVHDIYAEWRAVFNEYDPPRTAVAEAWVHPSRRSRYAHPEGLGQAFNFDLLEADWSAESFSEVVAHGLAEADLTGTSTTWVLSNHDVVRHPTRYGLVPLDGLSAAEVSRAWLQNNGTSPRLDRDLGLRRATAATLLSLALPGSAYLYQGEELGLHEVGDLPADVLQDPVFRRTRGADKGRDGCRVPLPWTSDGPSLGFGTGPAYLPQPAWFASLAVSRQEEDPGSTLQLYRRALALRRNFRGSDQFKWQDSAAPDVLQFRRGGGWQSVTNFGATAVDLPPGHVALTSAPLVNGKLPSDSTAWIAGDAPPLVQRGVQFGTE
jgi:alpha-glucosidase